MSSYLTENYGKGFSVENLKLMRRFYNIYSKDEIGETVFTQFKNLPTTETGRVICNPFVKFSKARDVKFYSSNEIVSLFENNGFVKIGIEISGKVQIIKLKRK